MNSYDLSRSFWDWSFENPEKIKPIHIGIYFFAVEQCNRLGWKSKFRLPTDMVMEAIGVKSYNTYKKALENLVEWGFIMMIERSKNQYSANIIALSNFDKAHNKALDKALIKHSTKHTSKQSESTIQSTDSINKPINKETNKPINRVERTDTPVPIFKSEKYFSVDFLKKEILKNKKICELIFQNKKNEIGNLEKLKLRLDDFENQLSESLIYEKQGNDFCKHFLNWNRKNLELSRTTTSKNQSNKPFETSKVEMNF